MRVVGILLFVLVTVILQACGPVHRCVGSEPYLIVFPRELEAPQKGDRIEHAVFYTEMYYENAPYRATLTGDPTAVTFTDHSQRCDFDARDFYEGQYGDGDPAEHRYRLPIRVVALPSGASTLMELHIDFVGPDGEDDDGVRHEFKVYRP